MLEEKRVYKEVKADEGKREGVKGRVRGRGTDTKREKAI